MDILIMKMQFSLSLESNESNLLALKLLANVMRLLKMPFQRDIVFIIGPSILVLRTKETFFMSFVQMFFKLIVIEQMLIAEFTQRMQRNQIVLFITISML